MNHDIDNLIRGARPRVEEPARERAIQRTAPAFVAPAPPTPWLRIAAVLALACAAGFAAASWLGPAPPGQAEVIQARNELAGLEARTRAFEEAAQRIEVLNRKADDLLKTSPRPLDQALKATVEEIASRRHRERLEQQRERHLAYVRKRYEQDVERTMAHLKRDYNLGKEPESRLRGIFAQHGEQVQTLISRNYRGKTRSLRGEFTEIKRATDARVESLLSEVPLNMPGSDLAQWGPNPEFETWADYESIQRWSEQAQQTG